MAVMRNRVRRWVAEVVRRSWLHGRRCEPRLQVAQVYQIQLRVSHSIMLVVAVVVHTRGPAGTGGSGGGGAGGATWAMELTAQTVGGGGGAVVQERTLQAATAALA
jgi:hypothetical protein